MRVGKIYPKDKLYPPKEPAIKAEKGGTGIWIIKE